MKQMIQRMREEKGGFTLAELLIVVAIVAVLVAIAIPVFTSSLDKANAQTDAANIRAGYASAMIKTTENPSTAVTYKLNTDGSVGDGTGAAYTTKGDASKLDTPNETIGGQSAESIGWTKGSRIAYTWTPSTTAGTDGTLTISAAKPAAE